MTPHPCRQWMQCNEHRPGTNPDFSNLKNIILEGNSDPVFLSGPGDYKMMHSQTVMVIVPPGNVSEKSQ